MKKDSRKPRSKDRGFTLLEVLLAVLLFTISLVALVHAFNVGMLASTDVESVDLALNIGQSSLESVKNTSYAGVSSSGPTADPIFPRFNVTKTVTQPLSNLKRVDITVSWNVQGGQTSVVLTAYKANH